MALLGTMAAILRGLITVITFVLIFNTSSPAAEPDVETPNWLVGRWDGAIRDYTNGRSERSLRVIHPEGDEKTVVQWSVTGKKWSNAKIAVSGDSVVLTTSSQSVIALKHGSDSTLEGTFTLKSGKHYAIALTQSNALPFAFGPGLPNQKCGDGTVPDNKTRLFGGGLCLAAYTHMPADPGVDTPVVVFLHGDGGGYTDASYVNRIARNLAKKLDVIAVSILRPGYTDKQVKSEGSAHSDDDDYRRPVVDAIAGVLDGLHAFYPGHRIILTGHSGGSALSALTMAIYPGKADGAVLVGCPCDVPNWRNWRNSSAGKTGTWSSLSPLNHIVGVSKDAPIIAVTGDKDDNTLPRFAIAYIEALRSAGVTRAEFMSAPGANHPRSIDSPTFHEAVEKVLDELSGDGDE